ncbi:hypothetical protein QMG83_08115 [Salinibacterium sp. G-O1]|uniref:PH-like domain-containing protein n=1 Tax=Salinibacterium sp. G-O1 TaxID=3046208 RepID=UPI0024BAB9F9|nr:hypothetical protein [Salinibacterium sp. G-O1]MDJ0335188.1 hypothetical protein [Salinibacterium sp. G-O1]
MDRTLLQAIVLVFLASLLLLMFLGWRARQRRQRDVVPLVAAPADLGNTLASLTGKYVATTASGNPLDRIAVHGLGFRSNVMAVVADSGILLQLPGRDLFIPLADLRDVRRATWTIDRVVEKDGLHLIEWMLGDRVVDSYLRMAEPTEFEQAVRSLLAKRQANTV